MNKTPAVHSELDEILKKLRREIVTTLNTLKGTGRVVRIDNAIEKATTQITILINEASTLRAIEELEGLKLEYMQCRNCKGAHLIASAPQHIIKDRINQLKSKGSETS